MTPQEEARNEMAYGLAGHFPDGNFRGQEIVEYLLDDVSLLMTAIGAERDFAHTGPVEYPFGLATAGYPVERWVTEWREVDSE